MKFSFNRQTKRFALLKSMVALFTACENLAITSAKTLPLTKPRHTALFTERRRVITLFNKINNLHLIFFRTRLHFPYNAANYWLCSD